MDFATTKLLPSCPSDESSRSRCFLFVRLHFPGKLLVGAEMNCKMFTFMFFCIIVFLNPITVAQAKGAARSESSIISNQERGLASHSSLHEADEQSDSHNYSAERPNNTENAYKLAAQLPGRYVNFDLIQLMGGSSKDDCPLSTGIGQMLIINNDTTSLRYSQLFLSHSGSLNKSEFSNETDSACEAEFDHLPFMTFHRLTPDMFPASEDDPSHPHDKETSRFKRSRPLTHSLLHSFKRPFSLPKDLISSLLRTHDTKALYRQMNTANVGDEPTQDGSADFELSFTDQIFKWFAQIPEGVVSCDNGTTHLPELTLFVIDAKNFANIAVRAWLYNSTKENEDDENGGQGHFFEVHDADHDEAMTQRTPQDEKQQTFTNPLEQSVQPEFTYPSTDGSGLRHHRNSPENDTKFLKGNYFISVLSENFSCIYMRPEDADLLKAEFTRKFTQQVTTIENREPNTLEFDVLCDCEQKYSENIIIKLPRDPSIVSRSAKLQSRQEGNIYRPEPLTYPFSFKFETTQRVGLPTNTEALLRSLEEEDYSSQNQTYGLPVIKFNGHTCMVTHALPVGTFLDQVDLDLSFHTLNGFIAGVLLSKYYQELTGLQDVPTEDVVSKIGLRKSALQQAVAAGDESLVIHFENGTRCNDTVLMRDYVFLVEKKHIFHQLQRLAFFSSLDEHMLHLLLESGTVQSNFTIHAFSRNAFGYGVCVYSGSRTAVNFLEPYCGQFKALGSFVSRDRDSSGITSNAEPSRVSAMTSNEANPTSTSSETAQASTSPTVSPSMSTEPSKSMTPTPSRSSSPIESESPGLNFCFPGAATAIRPDGSTVRMDKLKVGDYVRDSSGRLTRVLAFLHANNDVYSTFLRLETRHGDIILSPMHYLIVNKQLVTAETVQIGDLLELHGYSLKTPVICSPIIDIQTVRMKGLFNPITQSGTIAVAWAGLAVSASCFTASVDAATSSVIAAPLRWLNRYIGLVVPVISHILRNGSHFWGQLLPKGSKIVLGHGQEQCLMA